MLDIETQIRAEETADAEAISRVIARAFSAHPFSTHTEQFVVESLRRAGALSVSLVAERGRVVVGHVAFSPVTIACGASDWYGLGPLAVDPDHQRQGIGAALVEAGLARLRARGAAGCVVLGAPAYYGRQGFRHPGGLVYPAAPAEHFMALAFAGEAPEGEVAYHAAFAESA